MSHKVFVYGSLKRGFGNHRLLEGQKFLGEASTNYDDYVMHSLGGYPGVIHLQRSGYLYYKDKEPGQTYIVGEVYEVDDACMKALDRLEGAPSFYHREEAYISPHWGDDRDFVCIIYILTDPERYSKYPRIENGIWENPHTKAAAAH